MKFLKRLNILKIVLAEARKKRTIILGYKCPKMY